jgi:hypothetical protein
MSGNATNHQTKGEIRSGLIRMGIKDVKRNSNIAPGVPVLEDGKLDSNPFE